MNNNGQLQNIDNLLTIEENIDTIVVITTPDILVAQRLADHHLALAQVYRQMAGMAPILTGSKARRMVAQAGR
jgi:hypothetical protein